MTDHREMEHRDACHDGRWDASCADQRHLRGKLDTYRPDCDIGWRARAIDLPHIGEF